MSNTTELLITILPYFLSVVSLWMHFAAGNKSKHAWMIGIVSQFVWLFWIVLTEHWGLLPLNIGLWYVYCRNHIKWNREANDKF